MQSPAQPQTGKPPQSPIAGEQSTFTTSIRAWLSAMEKAKRIKPGGRLVFVNRRTGSAVPVTAADHKQVSGVE